MNIVHISQSDNQGGAAIAALRLHNAMLKAGVHSTLFVLRRNIKDREDIVSLPRFKVGFSLLLNVLERMLRKRMSGVPGFFSSFRFGFDITKWQCIKDADIIYLHWINGFINYFALKKICKSGKPVFWFMHDMFAVTGGCHYSFECAAYESTCENCPYAGSRHSPVSRQFRQKLKLYRKFKNLSFIAPSKWLFECAKKSGLTKDKRIYHIPNLIDDTVFKPVDKNAAYLLFSLDNDKKYIGFGAESALTNPYKGWQYLKSALSLVLEDEDFKPADNDNIELIIFGSSYNSEIADSIPCKAHFQGHLADEPSMVMIYNALDVYVIPSTAENFPNTILESLACNTPVVGFDVGGIPDMVSTETGYLARYKDSTDLARGIKILLKNPIRNVQQQSRCWTQDAILEKHRAMWKDCHAE